MSGTAPEPADATAPDHAPMTSETSTAPPDGDAWDEDGPRPRARGRGWWWLVVVLVVAVVVLLAGRPWATDGPVPTPTPTPTATDDVTPTPTPTPSATPVTVPGADAVFDATTAATLFVTAADLTDGIPAAAGVTRTIEPGTVAWGLPAGSTVEPASCRSAVTVVELPPAHFDATTWANDELTFEQDVVVLLDAAAARAAFRALVTVVDECPRYMRVDAEGGGVTWNADPALEGQGVLPAIVQDVTEQRAGDTEQQTTGHVLVGNAILTWTATAQGASDRQEAQAVVGEPADLSMMVEERALAAVRALP